MPLSERVLARHLAAKKLNLAEWGLEGVLKGETVTLYHGTTRLFKSFDMNTVREELVNGFYGAGIFLTPSKHIAEKYANANRNMGFPPSIIADLKHKNPGAGAFMQTLYSKGDAAWDEYTPESLGVEPGGDFMGAIQRAVGGVDPNRIADIAQFIEGTKVKHLGDGEPVNIFNMSTGLPDWAYDNLDEIGLDSKTYRPKVYTVAVRVTNPLVTASSSQARGAKSKGYDSVVFYGSDLVGGVPEVAVFNPAHVKVRGIEVV